MHQPKKTLQLGRDVSVIDPILRGGGEISSRLHLAYVGISTLAEKKKP